MLRTALSFAAVAALFTLTPGLDTALVIRTALRSGRTAAIVAGVGVSTGVVIWGALAGLGITAVLTASRLAYDILRWVGAAYLLYLGIRSLLALRASQTDSEQAAREPPRSRFAAYRMGLLTNLTNPKVGVFYMSLLPQFIPVNVPALPASLLLAGIHASEGTIWLSLVAWGVARLGAVMMSVRVRKALEGLTGFVLIGFGVRLAVERR
jgi:RhtB (resistance to homoserine/threonine) family protein